MSFFNKVKWILGISMVFFLIIATNLIDKNNYSKIKDSVKTIYKDRLLVKGLILDIKDIVHKKELASVEQDSVFYTSQVEQLNQKMDLLISNFENTKLTKQEEKLLKQFKKDHKSLVNKEQNLSKFTSEELKSLQPYINQLSGGLKNLSAIQLQEGEKELAISRRAIESVELFTQIEIYFLIFLAVIVQIIVIYNPRKTKK